ncbi:unnamed protein product [Caenorhabditis auriculariae]|uniref:Band 7 domain-containing protein n=1 Tax=Caenorhabditis auriculariae TaxID=2777116 RepID=A0A8S1H0M6_9PELO|nr:unnamed protein product [Caenorhabditis auriculariae]
MRSFVLFSFLVLLSSAIAEYDFDYDGSGLAENYGDKFSNYLQDKDVPPMQKKEKVLALMIRIFPALRVRMLEMIDLQVEQAVYLGNLLQKAMTDIGPFAEKVFATAVQTVLIPRNTTDQEIQEENMRIAHFLLPRKQQRALKLFYDTYSQEIDSMLQDLTWRKKVGEETLGNEECLITLRTRVPPLTLSMMHKPSVASMHKMSASDRRQRLMRRIHTLQSEETASYDLESRRSSSSSVRMETPPQMPINPKLLFVPDVHVLGLDRGEEPPHKRDAIEKIPMRARSQSWLIRTRHLLHEEREPPPLISHMMFAFSLVLIVLSFPWCLFFCVKIIKEYQRAVVFRLGRLIRGGTKGPGLFIVLPCIDTYKIVDLRVLSFDVPPQEILSRDSVTVSVEAVIYFRVSNPVISVTNVNDAQFSTRLLAQTTLRNVLGTKTLSEMLSERDAIATITEKVLDEGTDPWGVKVERVEIKDIRLPHMLMRSMAAEAEAVRNARAAVIAAQGEKDASKCLQNAADTICNNRMSIQLRYLQTLTHVAMERNNTIVLPYPMEIAKTLATKYSGGRYKPL